MNHETTTPDARPHDAPTRTSHARAVGVALFSAGLAFAVGALASARGAPPADLPATRLCAPSHAVERPAASRDAPAAPDTPERRAGHAIERASPEVTRCVRAAGGSLAATLYFDLARGNVTRTTLSRAHGRPLPAGLLRCAREALARVHIAPTPDLPGTIRVRHEWRAPRVQGAIHRATPF